MLKHPAAYRKCFSVATVIRGERVDGQNHPPGRNEESVHPTSARFLMLVRMFLVEQEVTVTCQCLNSPG